MSQLSGSGSTQKVGPAPEAEVVDICRDLLRIDTSNYGDGSGPGEREAAELVAERAEEAEELLTGREAARHEPGGTLRRVHLPLMRGGVLTALILVFVETMKEMPATLLLRPFGLDTLAVAVWERTSESLWAEAAAPALAIVAAGLLPVLVVIRLSSRRD